MTVAVSASAKETGKVAAVHDEPLRVWSGPLPKVDVADRTARLALNPIVRAHLDQRYSPDQLARSYGSLLTHYVLTEAADAEVAAYPLTIGADADAASLSFVAEAETHGLRTLVFGGHDVEPVLAAESIILLHPGPTRGAQPKATALALPYLFNDRATWPEPRPDAPRPSVAFCGQGAERPLARARRWARASASPPTRHIALRAEALQRLRSEPGLDDRLVVRDRYRAGSTTDADRDRTQGEFDDNLRSSTYALCLRGTGNFSARFCEALSFGRVPLFVDTDCMLPFEGEIDWQAHTVWIDQAEVADIGQRLLAAHATVLVDPARSPQAQRDLWSDWLTQDGYFRHLVATLRNLL